MLDWLARIQGLNSIDNLREIMTRDVCPVNIQIDYENDHRDAIEQSWDRIELSTLQKLVNPIHNRLMSVMMKRGPY